MDVVCSFSFSFFWIFGSLVYGDEEGGKRGRREGRDGKGKRGLGRGKLASAALSSAANRSVDMPGGHSETTSVGQYVLVLLADTETFAVWRL